MTAQYTYENGRRYKKGYAPSELAQAISATCGKCGGPAVLFSAGLICRRCSWPASYLPCPKCGATDRVCETDGGCPS